jgi:N-acetylglucosaminyldiphosphoundecaprenol N-acetyl-beta-D-mannosaminyltransferase
MQALIRHAEERAFSVYLFGARDDVLERAVRVLKQKHPRLQVAGHRSGYFGLDEEASVVEGIRSAGADLLFVALATPEKELFVDHYKDALGVKFAMGVGGAFDVIAGSRRRAPDALQRAGLEWAYRLAQEPRRLARRYAVGNAEYIALVAREAARRRGSRA